MSNYETFSTDITDDKIQHASFCYQISRHFVQRVT